MRLSVLYDPDGSIVSVLRVAGTDSGGEATAAPQVTVAAVGGQRVAVVEVDRDWELRPLAEVHAGFVVAEGPDGPRLQPRKAAT